MLKCIQVMGAYKNANSKQTINEWLFIIIINSHSLEKLFVAFCFCKFLCCSDDRDLQSFQKQPAKVQRALLLAAQ